ncbi:hypothetical protein [Sphingomonas sp. VNH70]|uniref:hypothetical protein n=1 Tax=Sphingomonas silueang TaxID=3156617 RepID=UPI0032B4996D
MRGRAGDWAGAAFVALAALCATWLSGLSFPEQNNIWTIPVALDFAGSAEGPHDPYHASFARFVSVFWFALRPFVTDANIQPVYVALQLLGNALVAVVLYALVRRGGGSGLRGALVTGFLCFAFGLWGATRLGYSELFSTYATHTQYAVILTLAGLVLVAAGRGGAAGLAIGAAATANLFMGVWGALAGGIALLLLDRRVATPAQWRFALGFLLPALPVAWWALAGGSGDQPPVEFFRTQLQGHVYAADYPQAAVQAVALIVLAALALWHAPTTGARALGRVTAAAAIVLLLGMALPYVAEVPTLLLLHPLRFVSVTTLLAAGAAAVLLTTALDRDEGELLLPAFVAVAGFFFKVPVVSLFGLALAVPPAHERLRSAAGIVALLGIFAMLLPSPIAEVPLKAAIGFLIAAAVVALAAWRRPRPDSLPLLAVVAALGAAIVTVPTSAGEGALRFAALAAAFCMGRTLNARIVVAVALVSLLLSLIAATGEPVRLAAIGSGAALLLAAPFVPGLVARRRWGDAALAAIVLLFLLAGLARGAMAGFAPADDAARRDWRAAQHWTRTHTPREASFLPIDVPEGFALFARRPIWWEDSQKAAVLWMPRFYPAWRCRRDALAQAGDPAARVTLARNAGVAYLLLPAGAAPAYAAQGAAPVFRNGHYAIAALGPSRPGTRCAIDTPMPQHAPAR